MLARDIAEDYPSVGIGDDALEAARLLATHRLPGLVVTDDSGHPRAILPPSQVLKFVIPEYVQEDPSLARVVTEKAADRIVKELAGRTVGDLLPEKPTPLPVLHADDTVLEIAATMARFRCPLAAIIEDGRLRGVVTTWHLLELGLQAPDPAH